MAFFIPTSSAPSCSGKTAISANVFVVKNGALYTPALTEACVDGIMRKQIFRLASASKILTFESPLTVNSLMNADEVFLTNAINGLQWAGQYKSKFYTNRMAAFFVEKLNQLSRE